MLLPLILAGSPGSADYIGLTHRAERLAQAVTSAKACERFGYIVDANGLSIEAQRIIDDALVSGVAGYDAEAIFAGAMDRERSYQEERAKAAKQTGGIDAFLDHWSRKCDSLTSDEIYQQYFRAAP